MTDDLLSVTEASAILCVSRSAFYTYVHNHVIPSTRLGSSYFVTRDDLVALSLALGLPPNPLLPATASAPSCPDRIRSYADADAYLRLAERPHATLGPRRPSHPLLREPPDAIAVTDGPFDVLTYHEDGSVTIDGSERAGWRSLANRYLPLGVVFDGRHLLVRGKRVYFVEGMTLPASALEETP